MQANRLTFHAFLFLVVATLLGSVHQSAAYSVPTSITFHGYLVDSFGSPVTTSTSSPLAMRFGLYLSGTRIWYAAYSEVDVVAGSFTVHLGGDAAVAQGLDPSTGNPLSSGSITPITPSLVSTVTDQTPVTVQIEVSNGDGYDVLTPQVPIASALFAIRAETVGGLDAAHLVQLDGTGNVLDSNGDPIISSSGTWLGTGGGPTGATGATGADGVSGPQGRPAALDRD